MRENLIKAFTSSESDEWETPRDLFNSLDAEFHFTLDPCSTHENAKCRKHYTAEDDGFNKSWCGESVFCNPPYSKRQKGKPGQADWIKKCEEEGRKPGTVVVALLPVRTSTKAFHEHICGKAEIRFLRGRVKFEKNGVSKDSPLFDSMICIWRGE